MHRHRQRLTVTAQRPGGRQIDALLKPTDHGRRQLFTKLGLIDLLDATAWMHQRMCQLTIVGKEQHAFGVEVEPPDGKKPHWRIGNQVEHRGPTVRV